MALPGSCFQLEEDEGEEEVGWAKSWAAICCTEQQIRQRERRAGQKQPRRRKKIGKQFHVSVSSFGIYFCCCLQTL
jgi:hypothetical protein